MKRLLPNIPQSLVTITLLTLLLNGCATQQRVYYPEPATTPATTTTPPTSPPTPIPTPTPVQSPEPSQTPTPQYEPVTGQATALYTKADEALRAGQYANSEMLLERALRIEPQNAHYWYTLAKVKYQQQQYPQAVQFCLKADSLAGGQAQLIASNKELLENAKKKMGN